LLWRSTITVDIPDIFDVTEDIPVPEKFKEVIPVPIFILLKSTSIP
jgi:hypothetical protein